MFQRLLTVCVLLTACALPAMAEKRDIVHFGSNIVVAEGDSAHDIVCFLCSVDAKGPIEGDVVVFFGSIHLDEGARRDMVVFGGDIWLNGDSSIGRDLVLFGGTLHPEDRSRVGGNAVVFPPVIFLPILLVIGAIFWGIWMFFRWLIHGRQQYYPMQPPPRR